MRKLLVLALAVAPTAAAALPVGLWACSSSSSPPGDTGGSGDASSDEGGGSPSDALPDFGNPPAPDASYNCQINSSGSMPTQTDPDPVLLCTQQTALSFVLQYAYKNGQGVMSSWSSSPPFAPGGSHDWHDDVGLAAAIGDYHCSSETYGNNITTKGFDKYLPDLGMVLLRELSPLPAEYDGALYFRLHSAALAYTYFNDSTTAQALSAVADAYGRAIQASFTATVTPPAPGDGGTSEAGSGDGGPSDAGAGPAVTLIGMPGAGGTVAYEPAKAVMAAAALLDMARLHAGDADAGDDPATWEATALDTLQYLWKRARDPVTGLFYKSLVTSSDPAHDALAAAAPASDALLTDVQGAVLLGLARAYAQATALQALDGGLPGVPDLPTWGNQMVATMSAPSGLNLFDGLRTIPDGGDPMQPPPAPPGAFLEGYVPSLAATMTDKPVLGNAYLLAGAARLGMIEASPLVYENNGLRWALSQTVPSTSKTVPYGIVPWPGHSNLYSAVVDQGGNNVQQAFLRATSRGWGLAQAFSAGGDGGLEPGAADYRTDANLAFVEALTQFWQGYPNPPACVY